jgi:hypothetical protein
MVIQRWFGLGVTFAFLGGCVTQYVQPQGTPAIEVRFVNNAESVASAVYFEGSKKCTKPYNVAGVHPGQTATMELPANKVLTVMFVMSEYNWPQTKTCDFVTTFRSHEGSSYAIQISNDASMCHLRIMQNTNGRLSNPTVVRRAYRRPFFASGGFCRSLTDAEQTQLLQ